MPVNPDTGAQTIQREILAASSAAYRLLTNGQRDAWRALGSQIIRKDTLGQDYTLTGAQAYTSVNRNRQILGLAPLADPPNITDPAALTSVTLTATPLAMSVAFTPTPTPADIHILVDATPPLSAGITFVGRSQFKRILVTGDEVTSPLDIRPAYLSRYGFVHAGSRVFVRMTLIASTGFQSTSVVTSDIV